MSKGRKQRGPLKFQRVPHPLMGDCIICTNRKPDRDGYLDVFRVVNGRLKRRRLHRAAYEAKHGAGSIPSGYEIDHICGTRTCCNRKHLRALPRSEHSRITGRSRAAARNEEARCHWMATGCTGTVLAFPLRSGPF
jgi:hypothetical protein